MLPLLLLLMSSFGVLFQPAHGVPVALPTWATAFQERVHSRHPARGSLGASDFAALRDEVGLFPFHSCTLRTLSMHHTHPLPTHTTHPYTQLVADILAWGEATPGVAETALPYPYFAFIPNLKGSIPTHPPTLLDIDEATGRGIYAAEEEEKDLTLGLQGTCFRNTAFRYHPDSQEIEIDAGQPSSLGCSDFYLFATTSTFHLEHVTRRGRYLVPWPMPNDTTPAEAWDQATKGIRVYAFTTSVLETLQSVFATAALFEPILTRGVNERAAARNVAFLRDYAGFVFEPRVTEPEAGASSSSSSSSFRGGRRHPHHHHHHETPLIDESQVQSGDLFGVIRMDGLDPMLAWGMGATTGHMTAALWMEEELYVVESQIKSSYWPQNNVQRTPFRQWLAWAQQANYNVLHVPLSDASAAAFNHTAAVAWFEEMQGLAYGYHSLLWGWVDTPHDNYPCLPPTFDRCLEWSFLEVGFALFDRHIPAISELLWAEAFNLRVGTQGLSTSEVYQHANQTMSLPSSAISAVVEQDAWLYHTTRGDGDEKVDTLGRAMVCCVFVCGLWKAAGVFGEAGQEINCGELTNADDAMLAIFRGDFTQVLGAWTMFLPAFNEKLPFAHMDERCPSRGPAYEQPADC